MTFLAPANKKSKKQVAQENLQSQQRQLEKFEAQKAAHEAIVAAVEESRKVAELRASETISDDVFFCAFLLFVRFVIRLLDVNVKPLVMHLSPIARRVDALFASVRRAIIVCFVAFGSTPNMM